MRRAANERARTRREWRKHNEANHMDWSGNPARPEHICICDQQPNRFRKTSFGDCGKARCMACHMDKLLDTPTKAELLARDAERDGLADYHA